MMASDIDYLLKHLRDEHVELLKRAEYEQAGLHRDWIAAVKELRDKSAEMERQHGYKEYFNGRSTES